MSQLMSPCLQSPARNVTPVPNGQWNPNSPPAVLPRVAVAAPAPMYSQTNSWSGSGSTVMPMHQPSSSMIETPQASDSQGSSSQFRFLPGQPSSQDSQSTPSLSNRSVPRFLEEQWVKGEPEQPGLRQAPPPPPPLPGRFPLQVVLDFPL